VIHVDAEDGLDPAIDIQTINAELVLADLHSVEKRLAALSSKKKSAQAKQGKGGLNPASVLACLEKVLPLLEEGSPARHLELAGGIPDGHESAWPHLGLITQKPVLYVLNVDEESLAGGGNKLTARAKEAIDEEMQQSLSMMTEGGDGTNDVTSARPSTATVPTSDVLMVCASLEAELGQLGAGEEGVQARAEYLAEMGLDAEKEGLPEVIRRCQALLGTVNFYTQGP